MGLTRYFAVALIIGCAASAQDQPATLDAPIGNVSTPIGMVLAAAILRGSVPTIRVLYRREPTP